MPGGLQRRLSLTETGAVRTTPPLRPRARLGANARFLAAFDLDTVKLLMTIFVRRPPSLTCSRY